MAFLYVNTTMAISETVVSNESQACIDILLVVEGEVTGREVRGRLVHQVRAREGRCCTQRTIDRKHERHERGSNKKDEPAGKR